jgi:4a-hydroxytetrahydrobiopterin dehydratase
MPASGKVDERELQDSLANQLQNWRKSGEALQRTFKFTDFRTALDFVNRVGEKAEGVQHHPDIDIRYNQVTLTLSSHDAGGITRRDLVLAGYIDEFAPEFEERKAA